MKKKVLDESAGLWFIAANALKSYQPVGFAAIISFSSAFFSSLLARPFGMAHDLAQDENSWGTHGFDNLRVIRVGTELC